MSYIINRVLSSIFPAIHCFECSRCHPSSRHTVIDTLFVYLLDQVPDLPKTLSLLVQTPGKPEINPLAVVQSMHANLGPQPISNSGSLQDHLHMSIILSSL